MQSPKLSRGNYLCRTLSLPHFLSNILLLMTWQVVLLLRASCHWGWTFTLLANSTRGSCLNQLHAQVWAPLSDCPGNVRAKAPPPLWVLSLWHLLRVCSEERAQTHFRAPWDKCGGWIQYGDEGARCNWLAGSSALVRVRLGRERMIKFLYNHN